MSSVSSFKHFLENVLKLKSARAGQLVQKAYSDTASRSWLRPCSKKADATQVPGVSNNENPLSPSLDNEPIDDVPIRIDEPANDAPILVDIKAEMEDFDNVVEQRRLDRLAGSRGRAPHRSRKKPRVKNFRPPDPLGSTISSERHLASGSAGAYEAVPPPSTTSMPKTIPTPSTAPALAPNTTYVPSTTPAPSTASTAKKTARMPPSIVLGMPASDSRAVRSSVLLASSRSGEDARKKSVFDDDAADARLFATMAFPDDPYTRVRASSSRTMSRARLKFLAFVKRVGHELEVEIEKQKLCANDYAKGELAAKTKRNKYVEQLEKKNKELERTLGDNKRLRVENEKLAKKLETAKKDASNSLDCLTRRNEQVSELRMQVGQKRQLLKTAKALIVDLHEKFAIAKAKFVELKGDPQDKMVFQIQREANLDFVKQLLGLFPDRKVSRLDDELASLTADVEANVGDEEYFDNFMESLGECLDVVLPELAGEAGVVDASGPIMSLENAGGLLQIRIDSAGLLKNLMISEDGCMSFAGDDKAEVTTIAAEDIEAKKTRIGGDAAEIEKTVADNDGAEKAISEKARLTTRLL
ncbi:hypothetical protein AALP_AA7G126000 [Arabis alpina]|uniref:Uncharacterized protein n=1 Tax=Arabis alpina TaxID=50452 RepID=A0A087GHM8_ARAAL|nr:hypothetical protein AALP_AA7G126000 [Arabis alpina]